MEKDLLAKCRFLIKKIISIIVVKIYQKSWLILIVSHVAKYVSNIM